jgi:hypothetical protein
MQVCLISAAIKRALSLWASIRLVATNKSNFVDGKRFVARPRRNMLQGRRQSDIIPMCVSIQSLFDAYIPPSTDASTEDRVDR